MKELNLSSILLENRHKRGITQEQLAAFLGVSKASVSKWETGATYPDITLLPRLASYFHISIDELIGYQPSWLRMRYENSTENFLRIFPVFLLIR